MQYAMYYEEQQQISQDEYGKMKQQILLREGERKFESYTLRKLKLQEMMQTKRWRTTIYV